MGVLISDRIFTIQRSVETRARVLIRWFLALQSACQLAQGVALACCCKGCSVAAKWWGASGDSVDWSARRRSMTIAGGVYEIAFLSFSFDKFAIFLCLYLMHSINLMLLAWIWSKNLCFNIHSEYDGNPAVTHRQVAKLLHEKNLTDGHEGTWSLHPLSSN